MTAVWRQRVLWAALAASAAATAWVASRDESEPPSDARGARKLRVASARPAGPANAGRLDWPTALPDERSAWPEAELQARAAWGDAPAPPLPRVAQVQAPAPNEVDNRPPPPPPPPPFAYQLVGRMAEGGRLRVILTNAQRSLVVGLGEAVDGQWRLDAIEPGGIRLTHTPSGSTQNIAFLAS